MGTSVADRAWLLVGYGSLALGCLGWWLSGIAGSDPSPAASVTAVWLATAVLVVTTGWRWQRPASAPLPSAVGLAVAAPLAMAPVAAVGSGLAVGLAYGAATFAVLPLAWTMSRAIPAELTRPSVRAATGVCLAAALLVLLLGTAGTVSWPRDLVGPRELWWLLVSLGLAIAAAGAALSVTQRAAGSSGTRVVAAIGYLGLASTVAASTFPLAVAWWPALVVPVLAVAATVAILGRFAIEPLAAEVGTVRVERDLVVLTLEAERSRIAETIHDGPLGDLALLIQRLDVTSDGKSAALARSIAGDLRAIGNELRLPILEDLGAGPAIEWLAGRVSERTQVTIETELRPSVGRPPAPIELAVFRVAQEALVNATKHGRGPVTVRYADAPSTATLSVTDSGPGISEAVWSQSPREGHLGLRLMAQRAEAIGARLVVAPVRAGGTEVRLEWVAS